MLAQRVRLHAALHREATRRVHVLGDPDPFDKILKDLEAGLKKETVDKSKHTPCQAAQHSCKRYCKNSWGECAKEKRCVSCKVDYKQGISPLCSGEDTCDDKATCWTAPPGCDAEDKNNYSDDPSLEDVPALSKEEQARLAAEMAKMQKQHAESLTAMKEADAATKKTQDDAKAAEEAHKKGVADAKAAEVAAAKKNEERNKADDTRQEELKKAQVLAAADGPRQIKAALEYKVESTADLLGGDGFIQLGDSWRIGSGDNHHFVVAHRSRTDWAAAWFRRDGRYGYPWRNINGASRLWNKPIVQGELPNVQVGKGFIRFRDFILGDNDGSHMSISHTSRCNYNAPWSCNPAGGHRGCTAMIWRNDGTRHGGPRCDYHGRQKSGKSATVRGYNYIQFGDYPATSGTWRLGQQDPEGFFAITNVGTRRTSVTFRYNYWHPVQAWGHAGKDGLWKDRNYCVDTALRKLVPCVSSVRTRRRRRRRRRRKRSGGGGGGGGDAF